MINVEFEKFIWQNTLKNLKDFNPTQQHWPND
jgi:hypothetical protein